MICTLLDPSDDLEPDMASDFTAAALIDGVFADECVIPADGPTNMLNQDQGGTALVKLTSQGIDLIFPDGTAKIGGRGPDVSIFGDPMGEWTCMFEGFISQAVRQMDGWVELTLVGASGHKGIINTPLVELLPTFNEADADEWIDTNCVVDYTAPSADTNAGIFLTLGSAFSNANYTTPDLTGPITGAVTVHVDGDSGHTAYLIGADVSGTASAIAAAVGSAAYVTHDSTTISIASHRWDYFSEIEVIADSGAQDAGFEADGQATGEPETWLAGREKSITLPVHANDWQLTVSVYALVSLFQQFVTQRGCQVTLYRTSSPVALDTRTIPQFTTQQLDVTSIQRGKPVLLSTTLTIPANVRYSLRIEYTTPPPGEVGHMSWSAPSASFDSQWGVYPGRSITYLAAQCWIMQFFSTKVDWTVQRVGSFGTIYPDGYFVPVKSRQDPRSLIPTGTEFAIDPDSRRVVVSVTGGIGALRDDITAGDFGDFIVTKETVGTQGAASTVYEMSSDGRPGTISPSDDDSNHPWSISETMQQGYPGLLQSTGDDTLAVASAVAPQFSTITTIPPGGRCPADWLKWILVPGDTVPLGMIEGDVDEAATPRILGWKLSGQGGLDVSWGGVS